MKTQEQADACLAELVEVLRKHGFTLQHEDGHGSFELWDRDADPGFVEEAENWLLGASLEPRQQ